MSEAQKTKAAAGAAAIEKTMTDGREAIENIVASSKDQFGQYNDAAWKQYKHATQANSEIIDSVRDSASAAARGFEVIGNEIVEFSQDNFKNAIEVGQKLVGSKSVNDVYAIQSAYFQSSFESWVSMNNKWFKQSYDVVNEATAPVRQQVSNNVVKFTAV